MAEPTKRGLEVVNTPKVLVISKVISAKPGVIEVECDDGKSYKRSGGTLSWRTHNPGNLKFGKFSLSLGAVGKANEDSAVFPTLHIGKRAMRTLLFGEHSKYLNLTLKKAISVYAPEYDGNDPERYAQFISSKAKISILKTLNSLSTAESDLMIEAMIKFEGFKSGTVTSMEDKNEKA